MALSFLYIHLSLQFFAHDVQILIAAVFCTQVFQGTQAMEAEFLKL